MSIIEIFKELTKLQRCSGNHKEFLNFIKQYANKYNYICEIDETNNVLCKKNNSKANLSFQSHYDIVCLEENCIPTIIQNEDILSAKNSTLGSDNGIGCSYMLYLMSKDYDCEFLFTSDEEIGLIGANNLNLQLQSEYMLNLDSEEEGEICIGCAGGVDIFAKNFNKKLMQNEEKLDLYEISIKNLQGGHSGVDIDKNIPNAIKLLAKSIKSCDGKLLDINAGERINSIPANAKAIIATKTTPLKTHENMQIEKIDTTSEHLNIFDEKIVDFLFTFANGVRGFDKELNVVLNSINLAIIKTSIDCIEVELSARSMDNTQLKELKEETITLLQNHGFEVKTDGKYPAWKPDINEFTNDILEIYKKYTPQASLEAIHAGLECAIFKDKFPNMKIASIGPTIKFPHSKKENVSINSIENVFKIVEEITKKYTK